MNTRKSRAYADVHAGVRQLVLAETLERRFLAARQGQDDSEAQHRPEANMAAAAYLRSLAFRLDEGAEQDLAAALATMLGAAETDALDSQSNVWRSAMLDARAALDKAEGREHGL